MWSVSGFKLDLVLLLGFAIGCTADPIPYPNAGTPNPTVYSFTAQNSGDVVAYSLGSNAGFYDYLELMVNGTPTGVFGLNNQAPPGESQDFGHANAGDSLVFSIYVSASNFTFYSNQALNPDGLNHVYATPFSSDGNVPSGLYLGFEDLFGTNYINVNGVVSDFDYNDAQFVVTDTNMTSLSSVPEPGSLALAIIAIGGLAAVRYKNRGACRAARTIRLSVLRSFARALQPLAGR